MSRNEEVSKHSIVFFGYGGIGKTSLISQVLQQKVDYREYVPTIQDEYSRKIEVDGQSVLLEILDTSGQIEYEPLRSEQANSALNFVLGYSVDANGTDLGYWINHVISVHASHLEKLVVIIVEYKIDLEKEGKRKIPKDEAQQYLKEWRSYGMTCELIRVSVKENINVHYVFERLIRLRRNLDNTQKKEKPKPKKNTQFSIKKMLDSWNLFKKAPKKEELSQIPQLEQLRKKSEILYEIDEAYELSRQNTRLIVSDEELSLHEDDETISLVQEVDTRVLSGRGRSVALISPGRKKHEKIVSSDDLQKYIDLIDILKTVTPRKRSCHIVSDVSNDDDDVIDDMKTDETKTDDDCEEMPKDEIIEKTPKHVTRTDRTFTEMKQEDTEIKVVSNQEKFEKWLKNEVKLSQYLEAFKKLEANDIGCVEDFNESYLLNDVKVNKIHVKKIIRYSLQYKSRTKEFDEFLLKNKLTINRLLFNNYNIYTLNDLKNFMIKYGNSKIINKSISKQHLQIIYKELHLKETINVKSKSLGIVEDIEGH